MRTSKELTSKVIEQYNNLFIVTKHSYIYENSYREKYQTKDSLYFRSKFPINDTTLRKHLDGIQTCGIFADDYSKFIAFDVDTKENSQKDTLHLVKVLQEEFNISKNDIYIVFSGRKGYHVFIHMDKPTKVIYLRAFYRDVIDKSGFTSTQVEFRPSTQAIKLPLGKHPVTKKRSWYVDKTTLKPIRSYKPILKLTTISNEFINKNYYNKTSMVLESEDKEFRALAHSLNLDSVLLDENRLNIRKTLEEKLLPQPNTRHIMTLLLGCYLKSQGNELEETKQIINSIMYNTIDNRSGYIETPKKNIEAKTSSQVNSIYKLDYKYSKNVETLAFSYDEVIDILQLRDLKLMRLYLAHMIHSKIYANIETGIYYMTYEQLRAYGIDSNRGRTLKQILELSDRIEVVSRNFIDKDKLKYNQNFTKEPNKYRLIKKFDNNVGSIEIESDYSLEDLFRLVLETNRINLKAYLSQRKYYEIRQKAI